MFAFCIVEGCENEVATDYPVCRACAKVKHFTNRHDCQHCQAMREAELQTEPALRAWELRLVYSDDVPLMADMLSELGYDAAKAA